MKARASVFKVILQDVDKENGFDYNACAMMTEGYTPSDISALCGAAINSLLTENKISQREEKKKDKENALKSDVNSNRYSPKITRSSTKKLSVEVNFFIS